MDERYAAAVLEVFVALHAKGYIYRDRYLVNWDPGLGSAISDLEVEDREVTDSLVSIAYPLADGTGEIVVATVRPETMLGDTAVAVNPGDERYRHLIGRAAVLPLVGRELPIVADEHVEPEFGTGALKITPAHDPNDFEIARRHGLPAVGVIGEDGLMTPEAGERYAGLTPAAARRAGDGRPARAGPRARRGALHPHGPVLPPLGRARRAARLAAVVLRHVAPGRAGDRGRRGGPGALHPGQVGRGLPQLDARDPPLVHQPPALVGAPDPGLVPRRGDVRRSRGARRGGLGARPRRARHLVQLGAVAVRDPGVAGAHARARALLPDPGALDRARHHLPLGRAHGDDGLRVHGRGALRRRRRSTRSCRRPTAGA